MKELLRRKLSNLRNNKGRVHANKRLVSPLKRKDPDRGSRKAASYKLSRPRRKVEVIDTVMKTLFATLQNDFSDVQLPLMHTRDDLTMLPSPHGSAPWMFKRIVQLRDLWKRYTFSHELDVDLDSTANMKFISIQERVAQPMSLSRTSRIVISRAKKHISRILGEYDFNEHINSCRFSGNATVDGPKAKAYLDCKLTLSLTGTPLQSTWFSEKVLCEDGDPTLLKCWNSKYEGPDIQHCNHLCVINVPKKWDTLRSIMPNTAIGSYYTSGLDAIFRARLKEEGINLNRLQEKHKSWARKYSSKEFTSDDSRSHVTLDLKTASENFGTDLIKRLTPADWFKVLNLGRAKYADVGGDNILLSSFMGMGIGFTFTFQTLIFYSLLKAIQDLTGIRGRISVYGDDCIFPLGMYKYVAKIFPELRLLINFDKTFAFHEFRESCGGDYYRGCPVRPYSYEGVSRKLQGKQLTAELHKIMNGLLKRWDRVEIPNTVEYLETLMYANSGPILQVPMHAPAYSGILTDHIISSWKYMQPTWDGNLQCWRFACLKQHQSKRRVWLERFYLWNNLRTRERPVQAYSVYDKPACAGLTTRKAQPCTKLYSRSEEKLVPKLIPVEDSKVSCNPVYSDATLIGFYSECSEEKED